MQSSDFENDFILYTFSSDHSIMAMLTHKYDVGEEFLGSFMITSLQVVELNYPTTDKQDFVVFEVVKHL